MKIFDVLQLIGGIILAVGYIPQIIQLIRTKSCKDLNAKTYAAMVAGISLMEVYALNLAINGTGHMFLITNSISLVLVVFISILIFVIRKLKPNEDLRMDVSLDEDKDELLCPKCCSYVAPGEVLKYIDMPVPKCCPYCGQKLHY